MSILTDRQAQIELSQPVCFYSGQSVEKSVSMVTFRTSYLKVLKTRSTTTIVRFFYSKAATSTTNPPHPRRRTRPPKFAHGKHDTWQYLLSSWWYLLRDGGLGSCPLNALCGAVNSSPVRFISCWGRWGFLRKGTRWQLHLQTTIISTSNRIPNYTYRRTRTSHSIKHQSQSDLSMSVAA